MSIIKSFADKFEQVSIDEAFADVSKSARDYEVARRIAVLMKKDILDKEGLTCSVGIAPNKSTAKIAAEFEKPNGLTVVEPPKILEFLAPLPVSAITGVGPKTREFLASIGVRSIRESASPTWKGAREILWKNWGVALGSRSRT